MSIDSPTDAFWVLYLINVFQPISKHDLQVQTHRFMESMHGGPGHNIDVSRPLADLQEANMVHLSSDGRYAVTLLGLEKLSTLKLGRIRDKNRLFFLKDSFRK